MRATILSALLVCLTACGGAQDPKALTDAGMDALQTQDFETARSEFEAAIEAIGEDTAHNQYMRAKLGHLEALAALEPEKAKDEFLAMTGDPRIEAGNFAEVGGWLASNGEYMLALDVVDAGIKAYPEHVKLTAVIGVLKEESLKDPALASALESLGYL